MGGDICVRGNLDIWRDHVDDIFSAYLGGPGGFSRDLVPSTSLGTASGKIQY